MPFIVTPRQFIQRAGLFHQPAQFTSAGIGIIPALEQIKRRPPAPFCREPYNTFFPYCPAEDAS
jgi:hypothetical protein